MIKFNRKSKQWSNDDSVANIQFVHKQLDLLMYQAELYGVLHENHIREALGMEKKEIDKGSKEGWIDTEKGPYELDDDIFEVRFKFFTVRQYRKHRLKAIYVGWAYIQTNWLTGEKKIMKKS